MRHAEYIEDNEMTDNDGRKLKTYDAFILPFSKNGKHFKTDKNYKYIGYADADWNDITLTYEEGYFDLSFYEDMYPGGEHKTIAGHDAYTFVYSDDDSDSDYKEYTCYIKGTKEDDGYCIRVEKEDAFNYVINSINF